MGNLVTTEKEKGYIMSNNIAKINLSAQEISYLRENVKKMPKISPELEMKHLKAFHKKAPGQRFAGLYSLPPC